MDSLKGRRNIERCFSALDVEHMRKSSRLICSELSIRDALLDRAGFAAVAVRNICVSFIHCMNGSWKEDG
jgi:hypothetical protein